MTTEDDASEKLNSESDSETGIGLVSVPKKCLIQKSQRYKYMLPKQRNMSLKSIITKDSIVAKTAKINPLYWTDKENPYDKMECIQNQDILNEIVKCHKQQSQELQKIHLAIKKSNNLQEKGNDLLEQLLKEINKKKWKVRYTYTPRCQIWYL